MSKVCQFKLGDKVLLNTGCIANPIMSIYSIYEDDEDFAIEACWFNIDRELHKGRFSSEQLIKFNTNN